MKYFLAFCFSLTLYGAQPVTSFTRFCASCGVLGADSVLSESGQFIVHGPTERAFPPARRENEPPLMELGAQSLAVTAERSKRAFLEELVTKDAYQDKIHIVLLSRGRPDEPITVVSHIHSDGFQYQVGLPVYVEGSRLIKGLVQTLLQEFSNRGGRRNAELPSWLVEGMTRQLLASVLSAPLVNRKPTTIERVGYDRLGETRAYFQTNTPLTIQELSFSNLRQLSPVEQSRYESSAHLLVHELLQLRGGPGRMVAFLQNLPHALNWQTAFYHAYRQYFRTPLDLEKWWMLSCVEIKQREAREAWTTPSSLERLDALLLVPMEYRVSTNAVPERRYASLQDVLTSTEFGAHKDLFSQKLQQVFFLTVNLSPEVLPVAQAYEDAIDSYLQKRILADYQPALKSDPEQRLQALIRSTVKGFDELDQARDEVRAGRVPQLPQAAKKSSRPMVISPGSSRR
jgi:hypothetical protein